MKLIAPLLTLLIIVSVFIVTTESASKDKSNVITLSEKNTVSLNLPIAGDVVRDLQMEFMQKSAKLKQDDTIYFTLNSPGGSIPDGRALIELIKGLPQNVDTISLFSASMSFVISQSLGQRFTISSSTLMSHRATVDGVGGQVPGNFITRAMFLDEQMLAIDLAIARRAKMEVKDYRALTENELWMGSGDAITRRFADGEVIIRCDKTLNGYGEPKTLNLGFFTAKVAFHKCPLIQEPMVYGGSDNAALDLLIHDKPGFFQKYVKTGLIR